jgi:hypothetical protein
VPNEILATILAYVGPEVWRLATVCRRWAQLARSPIVWRGVTLSVTDATNNELVLT